MGAQDSERGHSGMLVAHSDLTELNGDHALIQSPSATPGSSQGADCHIPSSMLSRASGFALSLRTEGDSLQHRALLCSKFLSSGLFPWQVPCRSSGPSAEGPFLIILPSDVS